MPIVQVHGRTEELPKDSTTENIVVVLLVQVEKLVDELSIDQPRDVQKTIGMLVAQSVERVVEVPQVEAVEQIVEVPQVDVREVVVQAPRSEVRFAVMPVMQVEELVNELPVNATVKAWLLVEEFVLEVVASAVEVPQVERAERAVEFTQAEVREVVEQAPRSVVLFVAKLLKLPGVLWRASSRM